MIAIARKRLARRVMEALCQDRPVATSLARSASAQQSRSRADAGVAFHLATAAPIPGDRIVGRRGG